MPLIQWVMQLLSRVPSPVRIRRSQVVDASKRAALVPLSMVTTSPIPSGVGCRVPDLATLAATSDAVAMLAVNHVDVRIVSGNASVLLATATTTSVIGGPAAMRATTSSTQAASTAAGGVGL